MPLFPPVSLGPGSAGTDQDLLYEASCLVVEEAVLKGREDPAGRSETGDVVVSRLLAVAGGESRGHDDAEWQLV